MRLQSGILVVAMLAAVQSAQAALLATAAISAQQLDATTYRYDITLTDTGTTNIGTFWYAWVPGEGFLNSDAFNVQSPNNWTALLTDSNRAIQWVNQTGPLTAGNSLAGFQFDSHSTPSDVFGLSVAFPGTPVGTSFVYSGGPFSDSGLQFVVQSVPEPSTYALAAMGIAALVAIRRKGRMAPHHGSWARNRIGMSAE